MQRISIEPQGPDTRNKEAQTIEEDRGKWHWYTDQTLSVEISEGEDWLSALIS